MGIGIFQRLTVEDGDLRVAATRFAPSIERFEPDRVVYLEQGGADLGQYLATSLNLPAVGISISYPGSPLLRTLPKTLRVLAWPIKEIWYKFSNPVIESIPKEISSKHRLVLVDDSASSGRTIRAVLDHLEKRGVHRNQIHVVVFRCGKRARRFVDDYQTGERVLFRKYGKN